MKKRTLFRCLVDGLDAICALTRERFNQDGNTTIITGVGTVDHLNVYRGKVVFDSADAVTLTGDVGWSTRQSV